jgi:hypothetical protein
LRDKSLARKRQNFCQEEVKDLLSGKSLAKKG